MDEKTQFLAHGERFQLTAAQFCCLGAVVRLSIVVGVSEGAKLLTYGNQEAERRGRARGLSRDML